MKKRLLLILALGVSFSPAAFSATDGRNLASLEKPLIGDHRIEEPRAHEMKVSEHAGPDIVCPYAEKDRKSRIDFDENGQRLDQKNEGTAGAHSAS
jgi:hypothetical protein